MHKKERTGQLRMVNIVHKSRKRLIWELARGVSTKILELARVVSRNWLGAYLGSTGIFPS